MGEERLVGGRSFSRLDLTVDELGERLLREDPARESQPVQEQRGVVPVRVGEVARIDRRRIAADRPSAA